MRLQRAGGAEIPAQSRPSGWTTEGAVKKDEILKDKILEYSAT
jgi:hypothetical protein